MSTSIEWTDATWNPTVGCSRVSKGCERCYAERVAHRGMSESHRGLTVMGKHGPRWTGEVRLMPDRLDQPLRWRKPRRVFVNSMSDLFHEGVPFEYIAAVFGVMAASPQHTFQVLTKRPERARAFFAWLEARAIEYGTPGADVCNGLAGSFVGWRDCLSDLSTAPAPWPLSNVWIGVSVEDQATADERIPALLTLPAAVRWVSYEPALGAVDFTDREERFEWLASARCHEPNGCGWSGGLKEAGEVSNDPRDRELGITACPACGSYAIGESPGGLDWIVVGGESGPGARPFDLAWARSTIEQCRAAGTACFVKQLGARPVADGLIEHLDVASIRDRKGGDPDEWAADLRVRDWPEVSR